MKAEERKEVTQQTCDDVKRMLEAGLKQKDAARILRLDPSTISKIKNAEYRLETYLENRREWNKKAKAGPADGPADGRRTEELKPEREPEVPGQIRMELAEEKPEMSDHVKMMRFQAAQADRIVMALSGIRDLLGQVLRAVSGA